MTNREKQDLTHHVRFYLSEGKSDTEIIALLTEMGFKKQTIKKYIAVFKK
jgi:hypothetical protein